MIRIITRNLGTQLHFGTALFNKLAHLAAGDFRQFFVLIVQQIGKFVQHRQALVDIAFRPGGMIERIGFFQRGLYIGVAVRRVFFNKLIGKRIYCLVGHNTFLLILVNVAAKRAAKSIKGS